MSVSIQQAPQVYEIKSLTEDQKAFIKASVPILELSGETLTRQFYEYMLETYPEVRVFFNPSHQATLRQPKILAFALLNYAKNIDDISPLVGFVKMICVKHCGLQIKPEHYPVVGASLITTMKNILGDEIATAAFVEAWSTAYGNLAQIIINAEHEMYLKQNWQGFRIFTVSRIEEECFDVKSVYFSASSGPHIAPIPGQYLTFEFFPDGPNERAHLREYSISNTPDKSEVRISVRLVVGGIISHYIHQQLKVGDEIRVAPPNGNLYNATSEKDLVVYAGGIGITPMISIIEKALGDGKRVELNYSNLSESRRPFGKWLKKVHEHENGTVKEFITTRLLNRNFDRDLQEKEVYVIGPPEYLLYVKGELEKVGVVNVNTETFGPMNV